MAQTRFCEIQGGLRSRRVLLVQIRGSSRSSPRSCWGTGLSGRCVEECLYTSRPLASCAQTPRLPASARSRLRSGGGTARPHGTWWRREHLITGPSQRHSSRFKPERSLFCFLRNTVKNSILLEYKSDVFYEL